MDIHWTGFCEPKVLILLGAYLVAQLVKNPPAMQVQSLGWEDPPEKGQTTHSSALAWRTPWTVQSTGLQELDTSE